MIGLSDSVTGARSHGRSASAGSFDSTDGAAFGDVFDVANNDDALDRHVGRERDRSEPDGRRPDDDAIRSGGQRRDAAEPADRSEPATQDRSVDADAEDDTAGETKDDESVGSGPVVPIEGASSAAAVTDAAALAATDLADGADGEVATADALAVQATAVSIDASDDTPSATDTPPVADDGAPMVPGDDAEVTETVATATTAVADGGDGDPEHATPSRSAASPVSLSSDLATPKPGDVSSDASPVPPAGARTEPSTAPSPTARLAEHLAVRELVDRVDKQRLSAMKTLDLEIATERFGSIRIEAVDGSDGVQLSLRGDGSARGDLAALATELRQSFDRDGHHLAGFAFDQGDGRGTDDGTDPTTASSAPDVAGTIDLDTRPGVTDSLAGLDLRI